MTLVDALVIRCKRPPAERPRGRRFDDFDAMMAERAKRKADSPAETT